MRPKVYQKALQEKKQWNSKIHQFVNQLSLGLRACSFKIAYIKSALSKGPTRAKRGGFWVSGGRFAAEARVFMKKPSEKTVKFRTERYNFQSKTVEKFKWTGPGLGLLLVASLTACSADDAATLDTSSAGLTNKDIEKNDTSNSLLCNAACQRKVDQCFIPFKSISFDELPDTSSIGSLTGVADDAENSTAPATRCESGSCTVPGEAEFCTRVCPNGVDSTQIRCLQISSCQALGDGRDFDQTCPADDATDDDSPALSCPDTDLCDGSRLLSCELIDGVLVVEGTQCELGCDENACVAGVTFESCKADYPRCITESGTPYKESCSFDALQDRATVFRDECVHGCEASTDEGDARTARCSAPPTPEPEVEPEAS